MQLTKIEFIDRVIAFISPDSIAAMNMNTYHASHRFDSVIGSIQRYAKYNEEDGIPFSCENICYGIKWSINSGRINGQAVAAIYNLSAVDLIELVYELNTKFDVIADIPRYLIEKFTTIQ